MMEVGRLCVKLAGRDAGLKCVIVDVLDDSHVLIDGQTRRRKCNVKHLEPLKDVVKLKKGASRADVKKEFSKLKIEVKDSKPKKTPERPKKIKQKKEAPASIDEATDKAAKKAEVKAEKKAAAPSVIKAAPAKKPVKKAPAKKPAAKKAKPAAKKPAKKS
jgi:large subunit ribosomal protein L14e